MSIRNRRCALRRGPRFLGVQSLERRDLFAGDVAQAVAASDLANPDLAALVATVEQPSGQIRISHGGVLRNFDADKDGSITPVDALRVINHLGRPDAEYAPELDTNGDGIITPLDPLLIINQLHRDHVRTEAIQQAIDDLAARLMTRAEYIELQSATKATWPDGNLGLGFGEATPQEVHGFRIVLRNLNDTFEYRSGYGLTVLNLESVDMPSLGTVGGPIPRSLWYNGLDGQGNVVDRSDELLEWEAERISAAADNLADLLFVPHDAIKVVSSEPYSFWNVNLGIGRRDDLFRIALAPSGLRIVLSYELNGTELLYEYHDAGRSVLVLGDLPQVPLATD